MLHEEVLKSFYAKLKGVGNEDLIRVVDLAREHKISYRKLSSVIRSSGLVPLWIWGKAFITGTKRQACCGLSKLKEQMKKDRVAGESTAKVYSDFSKLGYACRSSRCKE